MEIYIKGTSLQGNSMGKEKFQPTTLFFKGIGLMVICIMVGKLSKIKQLIKDLLATGYIMDLENFSLMMEAFIKEIWIMINTKEREYLYSPKEINMMDNGSKIKSGVLELILGLIKTNT